MLLAKCFLVYAQLYNECLNRRAIVHRDLGRLVHNTTLTLASRAERQRRVLTSVAEDHSQFNVPAFSNDAEHKNIDSSLLSMIKATKANIKIKILINNKEVSKSVRPCWQDGLARGGSTVWLSLSIARWPIAGRGVVYSLTGEYQDAVPGGGQWGGWLHHSSHPWTPQQGEQIGPQLHGRTQREQPSSALPLLAANAPVYLLL